MGRVLLLSYATDEFRQCQRELGKSAIAVGFDDVIDCGPADLSGSEFARRNAATLAEKRGGGYWLWKPYLIHRHLRALEPGDVLVYSDVGRSNYYRFNRFPSYLVERTRREEHGFTVGPLLRQHGPLTRWVKRDALVLMNADRAEITSQPTCQASPNFWRPTSRSFALLDAWLAAAEDPRILTDQPNTCGFDDYPDFIGHRHDQAILSILVQRDSLPVLDLVQSGIFSLMNLRPSATRTHLYLKSPSNVERVASGAPYRRNFVGEALRDFLGLAQT